MYRTDEERRKFWRKEDAQFYKDFGMGWRMYSRRTMVLWTLGHRRPWTKQNAPSRPWLAYERRKACD